jgi:hypothetical protein
MINLYYPRQKGFSLIELLLVLGVLAILLVAAFVVYPQVRDRNRANTEAMNLASIKAAVLNLYASKGGFTGLKNDVANSARVVPATMNGGDYSPTASIKSTWGEDVTIGAVSTQINIPSVVPGNRSFRIIYAKVPQSICLPMVTAAAGNFFKITVNGTDLIANENGVIDFSPQRAAEACAADTNEQVAFYAR